LADLPADLRWLYESGAVTLEQLAAIHRALGVTSAADLAAAVDQRQLRDLPGVGESVEAAIARALPTLRATIPRIPLGRAMALVEPLIAQLRRASGDGWAAATGSLRRAQDMVGDIEIVAPAAEPERVIDAILQGLQDVRCLHRSARRLYVLVERTQV